MGITGSIAAYKAILLVRYFVKEGAEVKVILTPAAKDFVSPLVLSTLSKNEVYSEIFTENNWSNHVQLGRWADVMLIAPLSCNTLAKIANGICDNLLTAVYLSATCPIVVAPAMDEDMWHHPSTKRNLELIQSYKNNVIPVENGELASGLVGEGRMAEPVTIINFLIENYFREKDLTNVNVLVTAGPTYESIDPVRFIGNHSSGKMGFAIAEAFYLKGANVTLITGPSNEKLTFSSIQRINITNSNEMLEEVNKYKEESNIIVMSAAVADYKTKNVSETKIKKSEQFYNLELEKTTDILKSVGQNKKSNQFIAGFALETNDEKENAIKKLRSKNLDCIILNTLNESNQVFGSDENKITIIDSLEQELIFETKSKKEVAQDIVSFIISKIKNEKN